MNFAMNIWANVLCRANAIHPYIYLPIYPYRRIAYAQYIITIFVTLLALAPPYKSTSLTVVFSISLISVFHFIWLWFFNQSPFATALSIAVAI